MRTGKIYLLTSLVFWSLLFAVPTSLQVQDGFQPVKKSFHFNDIWETALSLTLDRPSMIYMVLGFQVPQKSVGGESVSFEINGKEIRRFPVHSVSRWEEHRFLVPPHEFREGENDLSIKLTPTTETRFTANIKLFNYVGSSPNVPVIYVLPREERAPFIPKAVSGNFSGTLCVTFIIAFLFFLVYFQVIRRVFYDENKACISAANRAFAFTAFFPWAVLFYGFASSSTVIYPQETVVYLLVIYILTYQFLGIFLMGAIFPESVNVFLPHHNGRGDYPRPLINKLNRELFHWLESHETLERFRCALFLITGLSLLGYLFLSMHFSVNISGSEDHYVLEGGVGMSSASTMNDKLKFAFQQKTEHRHVMMRLIAWLYYESTGEINFQALTVLGVLAYLIMSFVYFRMIPVTSFKSYFFIPVLPFFLSLQSWEPMGWALVSINNYLPLLFAGISFYFMPKSSQLSFFLAIVFAFLCTFTKGNGIFVFISGCFYFMTVKNQARRWIWISLSFLTLFIYLQGYQTPQFGPEEIKMEMTAFNFAVFFLTFMGAWGGFGKVWLSVLLGMAIVSYLSWLLWKKYYLKNPTVFFFMFFIVLTGLALALSRTTLGLDFAFASRYFIFSGALLILIYFSILDLFFDENRQRKLLFPVYVLLVGIAVNLMVVKDNLFWLETRKVNLIKGVRNQLVVEEGSLNFDQLKKENAQMYRTLEKGFYRLPCEDIFPGQKIQHPWCG